MRFPGVTKEAAELLVNQKGALGLGIDTLSPDGGSCGGGKVRATRSRSRDGGAASTEASLCVPRVRPSRTPAPLLFSPSPSPLVSHPHHTLRRRCQFEVHHAVLGSDRYLLENLLLTAELPARGASVIVAPLNVAGAPEAPARVWALLG